jgi:DNA-binding LacI/PurR family transcriptional regulator
LFWRRLALQLRRLLKSAGHPVRLYFGDNGPDRSPREVTCTEFLEAVDRDELAAVAMLNAPRSPRWCEPLARRHVPIVATMGGYDGSVLMDTPGLLRAATERLVAAGRRRIALLRWARGVDAAWPDDAELRVFRAVLAEHGLPFHNQWVRGDINPSSQGSGWEEFREIWSAGPGHPDALVVTDDVLFRSAVPAIVQAGIQVPAELLIATHAVKGADCFCPFPVLSIEVDPDEMARELSAMLCRLLRGEKLPHSQVVLPARWTDDEAIETPARAPLAAVSGGQS